MAMNGEREEYDLLKHLREIGEFSSAITPEIIHSFDENGQTKVRIGWFTVVGGILQGALRP